MREEKKSIYNVSRPNHFGSLKKAPFDVPQQQEQNVENANKEFITWLEQNVDQPLQAEMNANRIHGSKLHQSRFYQLKLPSPAGNEMEAFKQRISESDIKNIMIKEYNLKDVGIRERQNGDLFLSFFITR